MGNWVGAGLDGGVLRPLDDQLINHCFGLEGSKIRSGGGEKRPSMAGRLVQFTNLPKGQRHECRSLRSPRHYGLRGWLLELELWQRFVHRLG